VIETILFDGSYGLPAAPNWRESEWSGWERQLTIDGRQVNFAEVGEGPHGFVLIHGMGGRWQHWLETIPFLAQRGRVLVIDLPGFGRSELPAGGVLLDGLADTTAALCRAVGLERVVVLGHSMGGPIALRFATRHGDLTEAIVLVAGATDTFNAVLGLRSLAKLARQQPKKTAATFTEVLTVGIPTPRILQRLIIGRPWLRQALLWPYLHRPRAMQADSLALLLGGAGTPGVLPTARAIGRSDPRWGLAETQCPILSIGARHDHICPPTDLETWAGLKPQATTVLLEECGHMLMLERPQAFNDQVGQFLSQVGGPWGGVSDPMFSTQ
jgi:pimeloyl-ACP methyl ester carboxylesterase